MRSQGSVYLDFGVFQSFSLRRSFSGPVISPNRADISESFVLGLSYDDLFSFFIDNKFLTTWEMLSVRKREQQGHQQQV